MRIATAVFSVFLLANLCLAQTRADRPALSYVTAKDGTRLALECAGAGPNLLIVHGGTGDRKRWRPLMPHFAKHFHVCAMDRRGHGESQLGGRNYSLRKEFEDVAAVVNALSQGAMTREKSALAHARATAPAAVVNALSQGALGHKKGAPANARGTARFSGAPVYVLGHSIGGVCALEAALLTNKIAKLALYEPPLQDSDHSAVADRMERLIKAGKREQALVMFFCEIVQMSSEEIETLKARPVWPERVAGIDIQIREIRSLSKYRFDASRIAKVRVPTLLIAGSKTRSPQLKQAITSLMNVLPDRTLLVLEGEEHNAMDTMPQQFAERVNEFLLQGASGRVPERGRIQ